MNLKNLKNRYFYLRHGRAENNIKGILMGDPEIATTSFGLIPELTHQVTETVTKAKSEGILDENTIIVSSDFLRTKQTAELAKAALGVKSEISLTPLIRERHFGDLNGQPDNAENVDKIYSPDYNFSTTNPDNGETVYDILERTMQCVRELEDTHEGQKILLVSHGDPIQILRAGFHGIAPHRHRHLPTVRNAEIAEYIAQF